jgi:hypothetical protein
MPTLLIRTSRGPYRRRTCSAPAAPLPSSVTSIRTYPAPSPPEAGCPAAASRAAEQGGMAGAEKRAGRLGAEPLLAPVIRVTGAEATSYSMTPRSPGGAPTGPASTGGPRRSSSRTPLPTTCPLAASTPSSAAHARQWHGGWRTNRWAHSAAQRRRQANAWASSRALAIARASSRACW